MPLYLNVSTQLEYFDPHGTTEYRSVCFESNMSTAFVSDGAGKTPFHTLLEYEDLDSF